LEEDGHGLFQDFIHALEYRTITENLD